ncbi:MAG: DEAD/DEAH box helicase, partial [Actinobacteria bacterium]|nr:DEAD/DEAH box helicase [Actinomycetota bacterium]
MVDLPVNDVVDDLKSVLAAGTTALLIAPPGAGKTTSVPLHLLNEPWMNGRKILMLEPRRLATRAAAQRMAQTTGTNVGSMIGYQTRDDRVLGSDTRIEVITEGILTRRMMNNPALDDVGLVIFDEVHERNLPTDLGIALTLDVMRHLRPDLRLLAMSATPDARTLVPTLENANGEPAPVIESLGRQHEVKVVWDPKPQKEWLESAVTRVVIRALNETEGDVLVFLPGMGEINRVRQNLNEQVIAGRHATVQIHRLAGALSQTEQDAALQIDPLGRRRVILSTDIAETSLTVDGVTVVVDAGLARVPRFDSRTGMTRLTTIPCSRANAEQRAGRAGRTQPGTVYRLWSKIEHGSRRAHLAPEITETELTSLALDLIIWGADESALCFPDPPPKAAMKQA